MRVRLYGLLVGLAAFTALAVILGETTYVLRGDLRLAGSARDRAGLAAFFAFLGAAVVAIVYEIRRAFRTSGSDA